VTRRSRSNSPATTKQAPQSTASSASASASASQRLGLRIRNDISATSAIAGRLASTLSCCATRVSETREETARPTQIAHAASSGMKTTSAGSCGAFHISVATAGFAKSATIAMNTPNTRYERPTAGRKIAAALPSMSSIRVTGVVSTGSRVPCSRSPTTENALIVAGRRTGTSSGRNSDVSMRAASTALVAVALTKRMDTVEHVASRAVAGRRVACLPALDRGQAAEDLVRLVERPPPW
jgi:hypothetical protein